MLPTHLVSLVLYVCINAQNPDHSLSTLLLCLTFLCSMTIGPLCSTLYYSEVSMGMVSKTHYAN
jgi:hypothetical protein